MSGLNELFGFKEQNCLTPEGVVMFYKGFQIVSTLEPRFVSPVILSAKAHGLFSGGTLSLENPEVYCDLFTCGKYERKSDDEQAWLDQKGNEEMLAQHDHAKVEAQKVSGDKTWLDESSSEEEEDKLNLSDFDASSDEDREPDELE